MNNNKKKIPKDIEECSYCGWETRDLHYVKEEKYGHSERELVEGYLCDFCYYTLASNNFLFPRNVSTELDRLSKQISYTANLIISKFSASADYFAKCIIKNIKDEIKEQK